MLQVFHNANFRMMWSTKWVFLGLSILLMFVAIGGMTIRGFNYGIDFAGGTSVQLKFREPPATDELRDALESAELGDVSLQRIGQEADNEVLIRVEKHAQEGNESGTTEGGDISSRILEALRARRTQNPEHQGRLDINTASEVTLRSWLANVDAADGAAPEDPAADARVIVEARNLQGGLFISMDEIAGIAGVSPGARAALDSGAYPGEFALRGIEFVGPTAGRELLRNTRRAIIGAVIGILLYVWIRFHKIAWGIAAIIALVHDVTLAAGAMALTGKEMSLPVVAALLTILGFSINDTIVVFDRIRENLRLYRDQAFEQVVNSSINQTLSRTVLTSFTSFVAVTALYMYGGDKLNPLAFCLMIGIVVGSYSSIFVASALLVIAYRHIDPKYVKA